MVGTQRFMTYKNMYMFFKKKHLESLKVIRTHIHY